MALLLCAVAFHFVELPEAGGADAVGRDNFSSQSRLPAVVILISLLLYVSPYATGMGTVPCKFPPHAYNVPDG